MGFARREQSTEAGDLHNARYLASGNLRFRAAHISCQSASTCLLISLDLRHSRGPRRLPCALSLQTSRHDLIGRDDPICFNVLMFRPHEQTNPRILFSARASLLIPNMNPVSTAASRMPNPVHEPLPSAAQHRATSNSL